MGQAVAAASGLTEFEIEEELFTSAPVGVHCVNSNGVILWANHAELNFLGFSSGEYVGQHIGKFIYSEKEYPGPDEFTMAGVGTDQQSGTAHTNLIAVDDRTLHNEVMRRVTAGNAVSGIPVRFVTRSGTIAHLLLDCDGRAIPRRNCDSFSSSLTYESATSSTLLSSPLYFRFFTRDNTACRIQEMRSNVLFQETYLSLQMLDDFMNRSMQQMRARLTLMEQACDLVKENIEDVDETVRGITISSTNATPNDPDNSSSTIERGLEEKGKLHPVTLLTPIVGGGKKKIGTNHIILPAAVNTSSENNLNLAVPLAVALSASSEARSVVALATTLTKDALALVDDITDLCRFDQGRVLLIEKEAVKIQELCLESMNNIPSRSGPISERMVDVDLDIQEGTPARVMCDRSVLQRSLALLLNFAVDAAANAAAASGGGATTRGKVILSVQDAGGTGDSSACKISVFYSNPMEAPTVLGAPMVLFGSNEQHPFSTNGINPRVCGSTIHNSSFNNLRTPFGEFNSKSTNIDAIESAQKFHTTFHPGPTTHRTRLRENIQSGMTIYRREKLGLGLSLLYHLVGAQGSDLRYDVVAEQQGPSSFELSSMTKFWFLLPMSLDFPDRLPARRFVKDDIQGVNTQVGGGDGPRSGPVRSPLMASFPGNPDDDMGIKQSQQKRTKLSCPHIPMNPLESQSIRVNPTTHFNHPTSAMTSECIAAASTSHNQATAVAAGEATKQYPEVVPGARPLVLVVEDTDVSASLICMHLRKLNCTSHRAENGEVAIEMLRSAPTPNMYSLILMDLRMPVMDGFEATKIIKSSNAGSIPVVALTGESSEGNLKRCVEIGFDAYQTKPLKRPELKELLKNYVPGYAPVDEKELQF